MADYWTSLKILNQTAGELGLPQVTTVVGITDVQSVQLLAMLNAAGNELLQYYPWEQFRKEWVFLTTVDTGEYALPADWAYAIDQTQWDRTDHWPLIGPKSAQEWAWLKGGLLAAAPRLRFRVMANKFMLWSIPTTATSPSQFTISQEYISSNWVATAQGVTTAYADMVTRDSDVILYDPWLVSRYIKMKFYALKGFDMSSVQSDFMRIYNGLTGKDVGAPILTLARQGASQYLGPWSVPDGSWNVGQP